MQGAGCQVCRGCAASAAAAEARCQVLRAPTLMSIEAAVDGDAQPAVVQYALDPGSVELREVPVPEIGDDDVLLAVGAVSVCGSDVHQALRHALLAGQRAGHARPRVRRHGRGGRPRRARRSARAIAS